MFASPPERSTLYGWREVYRDGCAQGSDLDRNPKFVWQAGDGIHHRNEGQHHSPVYPRATRKQELTPLPGWTTHDKAIYWQHSSTVGFQVTAGRMSVGEVGWKSGSFGLWDWSLHLEAAGCRLRVRIMKTEIPFQSAIAASERLARFTKRSGRKCAGREIGEESYGCRPRHQDYGCIF